MIGAACYGSERQVFAPTSTTESFTPTLERTMNALAPASDKSLLDDANAMVARLYKLLESV